MCLKFGVPVKRLKWEEVSRSEKWTRFCETIFREKGSQNRD